MKATSPLRLLPLLLCAACAGSTPAADTPAPLPTLEPADSAAFGPLPFAAGLSAADSFGVASVAPGVRHVHAWDGAGPWAVHVIEVDGGVCIPELEAVKAGPPLSVRAPTSVLAARGLAGVNADFFMLPDGTPVGMHVTDGVAQAGPGTRPVFAVGPDGFVAGTGWVGGWVWQGADSARVDQVNRPLGGSAHQPPAAELTLFTMWSDTLLAADGPAPTVVMDILEGTASGGRGRVTAVWDNLPGLYVRPGEVALRGRGAAGAWLLERRLADTLSWAVEPVVSTGTGTSRPVTEAVGGFPELLRSGEVVLDRAEGVLETFGPVRHPRTAVGWDSAADRLLLVTVDGRQPGYSVGMTLRELTALLLRLGATDAVNLDGGGSTAMVVGGRVVNRPSDEAGERSVGNALVLAACHDPDGAARLPRGHGSG